MQKQKNQKQIVYADVAIHDMPEKVSYKAKENREIKNSILVDLFYNDENAEENDIALYNALHEEPLPEGTVIQKMRVENALYLNFQNDISVVDIANRLGINRSYFGKIFKQTLKQTPQEFLINYRMIKATELLRLTKMSIGDISKAVGYENQLHFSRAFKKIYNISPREWRNINAVNNM